MLYFCLYINICQIFEKPEYQNITHNQTVVYIVWLCAVLFSGVERMQRLYAFPFLYMSSYLII